MNEMQPEEDEHRTTDAVQLTQCNLLSSLRNRCAFRRWCNFSCNTKLSVESNCLLAMVQTGILSFFLSIFRWVIWQRDENGKRAGVALVSGCVIASISANQVGFGLRVQVCAALARQFGDREKSALADLNTDTHTHTHTHTVLRRCGCSCVGANSRSEYVKRGEATREVFFLRSSS